ncbi:MAG: uraD [Aeromicrobium sp.]|nr:uraD [Aeromicrobium sp.]
MLLSQFNALPPAAAVAVVRPAADIPTWVDVVIAGRPYESLDELLSTAAQAAANWSAGDVDLALAHHPRIGERPTGGTPDAALSRAEQSAIATEADEVQEAIAAGNRAYEERFGRIFLIRAAGRSAAEVLDQLTDRLDNDPKAEAAVVAAQLREIALLRLEGMFG